MKLWGFSWVQGVKEGLLGGHELAEGVYIRLSTWGLQGRWVFKGKTFLEGFQNNSAPSFLVKNFIGGLTVAPHGDGFSLEGSRN